MLVRFSRGMASKSVISGTFRPYDWQKWKTMTRQSVFYSKSGGYPSDCDIALTAETGFIR